MLWIDYTEFYINICPIFNVYWFITICIQPQLHTQEKCKGTNGGYWGKAHFIFIISASDLNNWIFLTTTCSSSEVMSVFFYWYEWIMSSMSKPLKTGRFLPRNWKFKICQLMIRMCRIISAYHAKVASSNPVFGMDVCRRFFSQCNIILSIYVESILHTSRTQCIINDDSPQEKPSSILFH